MKRNQEVFLMYYSDEEFAIKVNDKPGNVRFFKTLLREYGLIEARKQLTDDHVSIFEKIQQTKNAERCTWEIAMRKVLDNLGAGPFIEREESINTPAERVKLVTVQGHDFDEHLVYINRLINGYLISIPDMKWSYFVGSWSRSPYYWEEKLEKVLSAQNYHAEVKPIADGLAHIYISDDIEDEGGASRAADLSRRPPGGLGDSVGRGVQRTTRKSTGRK